MNVNKGVLNTALEHVIMWMAVVAVRKDILGIPVMKVKIKIFTVTFICTATLLVKGYTINLIYHWLNSPYLYLLNT